VLTDGVLSSFALCALAKVCRCEAQCAVFYAGNEMSKVPDGQGRGIFNLKLRLNLSRDGEDHKGPRKVTL
jgi:hypothetical protein